MSPFLSGVSVSRRLLRSAPPAVFPFGQYGITGLPLSQETARVFCAENQNGMPVRKGIPLFGGKGLVYHSGWLGPIDTCFSG
jgi:hypothetical protein